MSKIDQKKKLKRQKITNSGIKLFNQKGFAHTKIDDIIADAKVGKGTFYLYFKNKEQLVEAILEEVVSELMETLRWVTEERTAGNDLAQVFKGESKRLAETLGKSKDVAVFINNQARGVSKQVEKMIQDFLDSLVDICGSHFQEGIENGQISAKLNPQITAAAVIGGISFTYSQWACGHVNMDVESIVESLLNFYLNALGLEPI